MNGLPIHATHGTPLPLHAIRDDGYFPNVNKYKGLPIYGVEIREWFRLMLHDSAPDPDWKNGGFYWAFGHKGFVPDAWYPSGYVQEFDTIRDVYAEIKNGIGTHGVGENSFYRYEVYMAQTWLDIWGIPFASNNGRVVNLRCNFLTPDKQPIIFRTPPATVIVGTVDDDYRISFPPPQTVTFHIDYYPQLLKFGYSLP